MKTIITSIALATAFVFTPLMTHADNDLTTLFQQGRAAYYKGDLELAKAILTQVQARSPGHFETRALLAQINTSLEANAGSSLKKKYSSVVIPKLELADVSLNEALQALSILSKNASQEKVVPNFIVKDSVARDAQISLTLSAIPLPEAINYLANLSNTRAQYEDHAVVFVAKTE